MVGVAALAVWLGGLLPGFGPGLGPGTGAGPQRADKSAPSSAGERPKEKEKEKKKEQPKPPDVPEVLNVTTRGGSYYVLQDDGTEAEVSLARLIELVGRTPGNQQGVKVRIRREATSRAITERRLDDALRELGLQPGIEYRYVD